MRNKNITQKHQSRSCTWLCFHDCGLIFCCEMIKPDLMTSFIVSKKVFLWWTKCAYYYCQLIEQAEKSARLEGRHQLNTFIKSVSNRCMVNLIMLSPSNGSHHSYVYVVNDYELFLIYVYQVMSWIIIWHKLNVTNQTTTLIVSKHPSVINAVLPNHILTCSQHRYKQKLMYRNIFSSTELFCRLLGRWRLLV